MDEDILNAKYGPEFEKLVQEEMEKILAAEMHAAPNSQMPRENVPFKPSRELKQPPVDYPPSAAVRPGAEEYDPEFEKMVQEEMNRLMAEVKSAEGPVDEPRSELRQNAPYLEKRQPVQNSPPRETNKHDYEQRSVYRQPPMNYQSPPREFPNEFQSQNQNRNSRQPEASHEPYYETPRNYAAPGKYKDQLDKQKQDDEAYRLKVQQEEQVRALRHQEKMLRKEKESMQMERAEEQFAEGHDNRNSNPHAKQNPIQLGNAHQQGSPSKIAQNRLVDDVYGHTSGLFGQGPNQPQAHSHAHGHGRWKPSQPYDDREKEFREKQRLALEQQKQEDLLFKQKQKEEEEKREMKEAMRLERERRELENEAKGNYEHFATKYNKANSDSNQPQNTNSHGSPGHRNAPSSNPVKSINSSPTKASKQFVEDMYGNNNIINGGIDVHDRKPSQMATSVREKQFRNNQKESLEQQLKEQQLYKEQLRQKEIERDKLEDKRIEKERLELAHEGKGDYSHIWRRDAEEPVPSKPQEDGINKESLVGNTPHRRMDTIPEGGYVVDDPYRYEDMEEVEVYKPSRPPPKKRVEYVPYNPSRKSHYNEDSEHDYDLSEHDMLNRDNMKTHYRSPVMLNNDTSFVSRTDRSGYYVQTPPSNLARQSLQGDEYVPQYMHQGSSEPDQLLSHFQHKYEMNGYDGKYSKPKHTEYGSPLREGKDLHRTNRNQHHFSETERSLGSHSGFDISGQIIQAESKFIPLDNVNVQDDLFRNPSLLEQSMVSDSVLSYILPGASTMNSKNSDMTGFAMNSFDQIVSGVPSSSVIKTPSVSKPSSSSGNRNVNLSIDNSVRRSKPGTPSLVLSSAVGKQILAEHGGIELDSGYPSDSPASINKTLHSIENRSVHSEVSNSLDGISHASIAATHGGSPRPDIDLSQPADTNELLITE